MKLIIYYVLHGNYMCMEFDRVRRVEYFGHVLTVDYFEADGCESKRIAWNNGGVGSICHITNIELEL